MPIAIDGNVHDDEVAYTAHVLGIQLPQATEGSAPTPVEAPGSTQTQGGTQVPPTQNNAPAGNVEGVGGIPEERYQTWPERMVRGAIQAFALPGDVYSGKVQPGSPQEIERAMDLAGLMVGGPAPVAAKMADGTLGSFAGVASKTIDKNRLAEAQVMQHNGASTDAIWEKTGFFKGADDRWRSEISDQNATLKESAFQKNHIPNDPRVGGEDNLTYTLKGKSLPENATIQDMLNHLEKPQPNKLSDVLDHPELYKAYPHLKDINVERLPSDIEARGVIGQMAGDTMYLKGDLDPEFAKSVILHELQHSIQAKEGFARGGSSAEFLHPNLSKAEEIYNKAIADGGDPKSPALIKARKLLDDNKREASDKYFKLMGEVEARNVQARMNYNDTTRKYVAPDASESVPRDQQIRR